MDHPLSVSQISLWLRCARAYHFRYIARAQPEFRPIALALGSAVHSAIDWFNGERLAGNAPNADDTARIFTADWTAEQEHPIRFDDDDTPDVVGAQGEQLIRLYVEQIDALLGGAKIVASESGFEIDLVDPETGKVFEFKLRGYFDALARGARAAEPIKLIEIKSSARRPSAFELSRRPQLGLYRAVLAQLTGNEPEVVVVTLLKQKKPAIEVTKVPPTDGAFFVRLARDVGRSIDFAVESGVWPVNPSAMTCSGCEFAGVCKASSGSGKAALISVAQNSQERAAG